MSLAAHARRSRRKRLLPPLTPPGALPCRPPSRRPSCLLSSEHWLSLSLRRTRCHLAAAMWLLRSYPQASAAGIALPADVTVPCALSAAGRPSGAPPSGAVGPRYPRRSPPLLPPALLLGRGAQQLPLAGLASSAGVCPGAEGAPQPQQAPIRWAGAVSGRGGGASHVLVWHEAMLMPANKGNGEAGLPPRLRLAACWRCIASGVREQHAVLRPLPADPAQAWLVSHAQLTQARHWFTAGSRPAVCGRHLGATMLSPERSAVPQCAGI